MEPSVVNIITTASIDTIFNIHHLSVLLSNEENVKYDPQKFSAHILKLVNPKCTVLVFKTGKLVFTGTKTVEDCQKCVEKMEAILHMPLRNVAFHNFVGSIDMQFHIDVEMLCKQQPKQ